MTVKSIKKEFCRKTSRRVKSLFLALMLGSTAWPIKSPLANPTGGSVRGGSATITYSPAEVQVNQQSERAIIEWQSFDIAEGEMTRFIQPSSSSIALNRVVNSAQASEINGNLSANGKVIVINPNGLVIGGQARVDTAGFVATSADIADDHFMNGTGALEFNKPGKLNALVENNGHITINDAGLGALVAPNVRNNGLIEGSLAKIQLAAADTFGVDFYGDGLVHLAVKTNQGTQARKLAVENTGSLVADGGKVVMTAAAVSNVVDSVINTTGYIRAGGLENKNGEVVLTGTGAHVKVKGTVDASGANGGGSVYIGGGTNGLGSLARASTVDIDSNAIVKADAIHSGNGGSVVIWSDNATTVHGALSAKGGQNSGNGGFIETSSEDIVDVSGMKVNTTASNGLTGRWLLDPKNLTIDTELASTINASRSNVVLEATNKITFSANINIAAKEVGLTATAGKGGIRMTETYIRTNNGAVTFSTTGTITLNGSPKEGTKFLYTRGGAIDLTGDKVTITDAQIGSGGGTINIFATAEPKGNTKTVTITGTKIDTSGGSEVGDIALYEGNPRELHDGKTAEEADFFGKENTFEAEEAGGVLSISGQSVGGNNNCFSAGGSSCFVSDPIPVTLIEIIADAQSKVYGSSDPIFTYTYVGDLQKDDVFSGALARSAGNNVGSYDIELGTLELSGSGNYTYTLAYTGNTLNITPYTLSVSATGKSKVYGSTTPALTYNYGALQNGDSAAVFSGNLARAAGENVGSYAINQGNLSAGNNYTIAYTGASLAVTPYTLNVAADSRTKVYGSTTPTLSYTYAALQNGDTAAVFTGGLARAAGENVGSYAISRGSLSAGSNYTIAYTGNNLNITPYALNVAAAGKSKAYGQSTPDLTYTYGSLQNGDTAAVFSGNLSRGGGENVGAYAINQGSLSAGSNYTIAYTGNTLNVTPYTLSIAADAKSKVYGQAMPGLTYTYGTLQNGDTAEIFNGSLTRVAGENVGSYAIAQGSLTAGSNYTIAYTGNNLVITPYTLNVAAGRKSKVYGQSTPDLTYSYGALQNGDTASIFSGSLTRVAGESAGSYAINQCSLSAGSNYNIAYAGSNLNITPYTLSVAATGKSKVYGSATPALTYVYSALQNGDNASVFSGSLARAAGENVGSHAINQGSLSAGNNYTIAYTGNTLTISQPSIPNIVMDNESNGSFGWRKGSGASQSQVLKIITVKPSAPVASPAPAAKSIPVKVQQSGTKQEKTAMLENDERTDKVVRQN